MSAASENGSGSYCSGDEDMDGLIAAVLQDIEIQDAINEGREEGNSDQEGKTGHDTQTNHINHNVLKDTDINNAIPALPQKMIHPVSAPPQMNHYSYPHPDQILPKESRNPPNGMIPQPIVYPYLTPLLPPSFWTQNKVFMKQQSVDHIVDNENQRRIDTKIALTKISNILREVDEDNNGEIDYEEFGEALRLIDSNLTHVEIDQIFENIVYNEEDELNIKLFIDLLDERWRSAMAIGVHDISPKSILQCSFKFIRTTALSKIYDVMKEKDEDENMCIDWSEFEEAMLDLEVNLNRKYLEMIHSTISSRQKHKELNVKLFLDDLSTQKGIENMNSQQILKTYFTSLVPMHKFKRKKERQRSMNQDSFDAYRGHKKLKKLKLAHCRFNSMSLLATASILNKTNCSVIVMNALRRELCEVDDNKDGQVDCAEFVEALSILKSQIRATNTFNNMMNRDTGELSIAQFIADISKMYAKYQGITGDQCIEKVSASYRNKMRRMPSLASLESNYSMRSVLSLPEEKEEEHDRNIVKQIAAVVDRCDFDDNGTVDREEFIDILSEWDIEDKFDDNQLSLIFRQLIDGCDSINDDEEENDDNDDDDDDEASCRVFMRRVQEVHIDHPRYSPRRAVYRVCRRLLKTAHKHH